MPVWAEKKNILIVDDEPSLLTLFARVLSRAGYDPLSSPSAEHALNQMRTTRIDGIVTDLAMPGMPGVDFMRRVRARDPDVPIVVITGVPDFDSALRSIECGVFRYVTKPVQPDELVRAVSDAVHGRELAHARLSANRELKRHQEPTTPEQLQRALTNAWLAVQPIVSLGARRVVAYEALLRTRDEILRDPHAVFTAAEALNQLWAVGNAVRERAGELIQMLPTDTVLFLNLHPHDLLDPLLFERTSPLAAHAARIVLEITERASLGDIPDAGARIAELKKIGYRIALDDMGAGYAGLTSIAAIQPHFVKIDLSLVRDVDRDPMKQTLIRTIVQLARELDIDVVAEGVETSAERQCLVALGCGLFQGYLFARPGAPFPEASV